MTGTAEEGDADVAAGAAGNDIADGGARGGGSVAAAAAAAAVAAAKAAGAAAAGVEIAAEGPAAGAIDAAAEEIGGGSTAGGAVPDAAADAAAEMVPDAAADAAAEIVPDTAVETAGAIDADIADAIEGHQRFRAEFDQDRAFFQNIATAKQRPRLLWIGCSDSRVVPAQITGADPGELFEIRNIANSVPPAHAWDDSVGAAIDYAMNHLHIDDIIVCGHTGCGGIGALLDQDELEGEHHLARWLDLTRPAHALVRAARVSGPERHDEVAKAHVQFQIDNLMTYEAVATGVAAGRVNVHGWLYDMNEGRLLAYDPRSGGWRDLLADGASEAAAADRQDEAS